MPASTPPAPPDLVSRLSLRERPPRSAVMYQTWRELLFLHWRRDPAEIQSTLPPGLFVDTFDGAAWLGVVPFFMRRVRPRGLPALPGLSDFLELNLRTYVHDADGRAGVWFYSLDCNQPLAVRIARRFFHLPYRHARMAATTAADGTVRYRSRLRDDTREARYAYRVGSDTRPAEPGSLEFFLVERYLLFAATPRGLRMGRVHHTPYALAATTVTERSDLPIVLGSFDPPPGPPDHVTGAKEVIVEIFPLG